jgi:DNA phosphorothioation-dependent restriction protein DptH
MLIIGGSGYGKTYTISCLTAELALQGVPSVIFDYAQGFSPSALDSNFGNKVPITWFDISRKGVTINPFNIHESDPLGPVNAAQRVADTFARVYPRLGVQQHTLLRQAAIDAFAGAGIYPEVPSSWTNEPPSFAALYKLLQASGNDPNHSQRKVAASVASHISTLFVFNTFRSEGERLDWSKLIQEGRKILVLCLNGLEYSVERAVTEFLLWSLFGRVETLGPGPLRCFVVLDEAHKLSFTPGSPVERLLREGRKFGIGVILSSQQPEDFSRVAFGNTATKVVFQVGDELGSVSRKLYKKALNLSSPTEVSELITRLPRGRAFVINGNIGSIVRITSFDDRVGHWRKKLNRITRFTEPDAS